MDKMSIADLGRRLNEVGEVFDKKPLTERAILIWFETLQEFSTGLIFGLLKSWAKTHGKFPTPSEVWKVCNEIANRDREVQLANEKAEHERAYQDLKPTNHGKRKLLEIMDILKRPKPTPIEHWRKVLADPSLPAMSHRFAREALDIIQARQHEPARERQPGED